MTTQELYIKLIAGDITEQKFLYEARRDSRLPFITKFNSLKDTVQILKNKGIIFEKAAKEAAGKQEVEIISKTIDMVNPYEYSRGMDYELGIVIDAAGNADLDEDKIAKAQKKVLKNLTNNSGYYSQKLIPQTEGESEYEVEVNAKSIEALKKKQGKIIREHGEEYDRVADVNADSSPLEEEDIEELGKTRDSIYEKYAKKYKVDVNELKDRIEAIKLEKEAIEVGDEDTAIAVQKKSPEADVRIVKK